MSQTIRVNFGHPMPLFPLPDSVLLPHAVQPLHIFEPRYCRMVNDVLDGAGQIAMASFADDEWKEQYQGTPTLRPVVCVGQIVQHERIGGGRHNILLHGVCRAKILTLHEADEARPYRSAKLTPIEVVDEAPAAMRDVRRELRMLLRRPRLRRMRSVDTVVEWFDRKDVSTHALLELIGFALVQDTELKYKLLAEPNARSRAGLIREELTRLDHLVCAADHQSYRDWPKGMSWN